MDEEKSSRTLSPDEKYELVVDGLKKSGIYNGKTPYTRDALEDLRKYLFKFDNQKLGIYETFEPRLMVNNSSVPIAYTNFEKYRNVFRTIELDFMRDDEDIKFNMALDNSELHVLLYPEDIRSGEETSVGSILHMFRHKLKNDDYFLPPAAAWETVRRIERLSKQAFEATDFEYALEKYNLKRFYAILKNPPSNVNDLQRKLTRAYRQMGHFRAIIQMGDDSIVGKESQKVILLLKALVDNKTIIPMEAVVNNLEDVKLDNKLYNAVKKRLNWFRPTFDESNAVDSLNIVLVLALTQRYYSQKEYFVHVSHSRFPLIAYELVEWENDPLNWKLLSREPIHLVARQICHSRYNNPDMIDYASQGYEILNYLSENKNVYSKIETKIDKLSHEKPEKIFSKEIEPRGIALQKLREYQNRYEPFISEILSIEDGTLKELSLAKVERSYRINELLCTKEMYMDTLGRATENLERQLTESYRILRKFFDERYSHLITSNMKKKFQEFDSKLS